MTRGMRFTVAGLALTTLLAVVAVASRAHRPGGGTSASTPHAPTLLIDYVGSAILVLFPIGVMIVIWAMAQGRHQRLLQGQSTSPAYHTQFEWVPAVIVAAIVLGVVAAALTVYIRKRRGGDEWAREAQLAAALDEVLAGSLDALRNAPDARRAVIRAYARMEKTFAAYGL